MKFDVTVQLTETDVAPEIPRFIVRLLSKSIDSLVETIKILALIVATPFCKQYSVVALALLNGNSVTKLDCGIWLDLHGRSAHTWLECQS